MNAQMAALKTIEKKEEKLRDTQHVLDSEITPTLTSLNQQLQAFIEYQRAQVCYCM
jgi:hypothetical protein